MCKAFGAKTPTLLASFTVRLLRLLITPLPMLIRNH